MFLIKNKKNAILAENVLWMIEDKVVCQAVLEIPELDYQKPWIVC